ncbi:CRISPR-associated endonuclease Cas1 [Desulfoglaeba alkanexedens]|uniref:CRISPR-associated endonuclease Cas1 n=1 Tax=Desulfoglaeba alkanexedens ALDC TaxID=980445 RepID=A0A4P8L5A9_9BACT|nr:CRISPR-associated endonuclease Cas1 [Desulfoglaeba alkanexedens]QCQ23216.1 CRISPR-associated endonuclease Cas1 [Desulfoglaeba alkanexedens ALDC]
MERTYVLEPGAYLRKAGDHLAVTKAGALIAEIPLEGLRQLTLVGAASLSGAVLDVLIQRRIETVLLTPRGRFRARLMVDEHKHVERRRAQYLRLSDPDFVLRTAKAVVAGKLRNAARFLSLRAKAYGDGELGRTAARLKGLSESVASQSDLDLVRGMEGIGGNLYFQVFARLIRVPGFRFEGRNRRPPKDPINALLSFVYTLLTLEVLTAVKVVGLDPYLGALHAVEYGRPSLPCDLVEEWRSFLGDRLVLGLVNRRVIGPDDFVYRKVACIDGVDEEDLKQRRPVEMKPKIARAFLEAYERWMTTRVTLPDTGIGTDYRGLIRHQVWNFCRCLTGERDAYEPFMWSKVT